MEEPAPATGTGTYQKAHQSFNDNDSSGTGEMQRATAHKLHQAGLKSFPLDHPSHPHCTGLHGPGNLCDGTRGKHPTVKWGTWAIAATPQMIDMEWDKRGGLANIGISCGPSGLVVFDEDADGELTRWTVTHGLDLPDTYQVATGRGTHHYYLWDHKTQGRIGNTTKIVEGFDVDIRGDGGFIVAEGSQHASGAVYTGNGKPIAPLPDKVAELLLYANTKQPQAATLNGAGDKTFWDDGQPRNVNDDPIRFHERHNQLVAYAGRLRSKGMDYAEAETLFRQRWLLCEQPTGQIPEAKYHGTPPADCNYPVTWEEALGKLGDIYGRYPAGNPDGDSAAAEQDMNFLVGERLKRLRVDQEAKRRLAAENRGPTKLPGFTGLDALLAEPRPQIRYRIEQVAPIGARVMLSAQYKAGKSHMGLNLARALVDGTPFLDAFPVTTRATKVVVIDDELSQNMMLTWWQRQQVTNTAAIVPVSLRGSVGDFNLLDPEIRDKWAQQLNAVSCEYLILDCLRPILDALGLDENHDAGKFLVAFDALLKDAGIGDAAVIHHMGHNSERARGDSRLLDWPDVIWKLVRANDDPASNRFFSAYGRDVDIPEGQIGYDADTGHMTFEQGANRRDAKQTQAKAAKIDGARIAVIEFLVRRQRDGEPAPSKNQAEQSKHPTLDGCAQKVRRDAFNALIADGTVIVERGDDGADRLVIANPCRKCLKPVPDWGQKYHLECNRVEETSSENDLGKARQDLGKDLFAEPGLSGEEVRQLGNPLGAVPSTEPPNEEKVGLPRRDFGKKDFAEPQRSTEWPICAVCSSGLFAPESQAAGVCERCRLAAAGSPREADAGEEATA